MINTIICGDCSEVMKDIPDESIDLVFTDPPYLKKYLYTYEYLADICPQIMIDGASLLTIIPHYAIPQIIETFNKYKKLKYRWILCMNQFDGKHARMAMGIEIMWKPILWYVKRAYPMGRGFLRDGIVIDGKGGQNKKLHKWEQDISWASYYIEKLTDVGDTVLDPFCGSGISMAVCKKLGRNYIGIDIDKESCEIAIERIGKETGIKKEDEYKS